MVVETKPIPHPHPAYIEKIDEKKISKIKLVNPYLEAYVCALKVFSTSQVPHRIGNSMLEIGTVQV